MDAVEIKAMQPGAHPATVLRLALVTAQEIHVVFEDDKVIALGGVQAGEQPWYFVPWLVMTNRMLSEYKSEFILWTSRMNKDWQEKYPSLRNFVHADNRVTIRWLKRLGYTVKTTVRYFSGEPFREFHYV